VFVLFLQHSSLANVLQRCIGIVATVHPSVRLSVTRWYCD